MFYTASVKSNFAWGVNTRKCAISFQHVHIPSYGVIIVSALAEAHLCIKRTLFFLPLLCGLLFSHILPHSSVPLVWAMSNVLIFKTMHSNILISSRLADELYQKVKRLFGDPHQATEDLKAEVIMTSNHYFFCFNVSKWMTWTTCIPICFPR